ncbi:restriction endonuclease subunit M [Pseudomonas sp. B1(2018)]|uniref:restriction endonuclease subunit S n=1 Tax=Pseudomonas sp. B1(2018) TaxID=2233856 RepID=UPI000D5D95AA|nr:restriction endonuclease subunit S [Pseudomonas sp. B1(2018)]PVZ58094.1 restriction endonuclease subunit M [Pseudomonas sp. B1(2018)]
MNIKKLSEIMEVRAGHTFRGKAEDGSRNDGYKVVQIKDIREGGVDFSTLPFAAVELGKAKNILHSDDILIPLRGNRIEAALITLPNELPVITTNQIAILSAPRADVKSAYICWYLNSNEGRSQISRLKVGSVISNIGLKDLSNLPVPLPNLHTQIKIAKAYKNWISQKKILESLTNNGEKILDTFCTKLLREDP